MINLVIAGGLLLLVGTAVTYLIKAKKKGSGCIGCPSGGCCTGSRRGMCSCQKEE